MKQHTLSPLLHLVLAALSGTVGLTSIAAADQPDAQRGHEAPKPTQLPPGTQDPDMNEALWKLQSASVLLDARVKIAQQQKELAQAEHDMRMANGASALDAQPTAGLAPLVLRVEGSRDSLRALILMPTGGVLEARVGDPVGGFGRVVDIRATSVPIEDKAGPHTLLFAVAKASLDQVSQRGGAGQGDLPALAGHTLPPSLPPPTGASLAGLPQ